MAWSRAGLVDMEDFRRRYPFAALVRPYVGLIERVTYPPPELRAPAFELAATALGNLTMAFPHITSHDGTDVRDKLIGGAGGDADPEHAWIRAVVEAAERYATMVHSERDFTVASAAALGGDALDLTTIPRCSEAEYADPQCPLRPAQLDVPIRWVRGYSLVTGRHTFVPAIMAHLYVKPWPAERFWLPISTGVAAHTDPAAALVSAICEVIERDAIALTWLARLPLPAITEPVAPPDYLAEILGRLSVSNVRQHCFDATTDIGIPTVFSVQVTENHPTCELFVSCATSMDPSEAYAKSIREASTGRIAMLQERTRPNQIVDFYDLTHGADYYGRGGHRTDLDFLLTGATSTSLDELCGRLLTAPVVGAVQQVNYLVNRLKSMNMDAVALDLTTDELRDAGVWVIRVIVPNLMPVSFVHRARYLGTPRLYDYPRSLHLSLRSERDINPGPMPFA